MTVNLDRRSFFGFMGGAAAAAAIAPHVSIATAITAPGHVVKATYSNGFLVPEEYAKEFLKLLKDQLTIGRLSIGED